MSLDRQIEQLCTIYAEKTDGELLGLHAQRDDLTDAAQQALAQVMHERKLTALAAPGPALSMGQMTEVKSSTVLDDNEAAVWTFDDAFQAREALRLLTAAEINHRVVDASKQSGDAFRGSNFQLQLSVIVDTSDLKAARAVLQESMGLFPGPEGNDEADWQDVMAEFTLLSLFERKDALIVTQTFGEAGISYLWRDGRDASQQLPDTNTVAIEVLPNELERAKALAEETLSHG